MSLEDGKTPEILAWNRSYFEAGCKCIDDGTIRRKGSNVSDAVAVKYYENNCTCSRNYVDEFQR